MDQWPDFRQSRQTDEKCSLLHYSATCYTDTFLFIAHVNLHVPCAFPADAASCIMTNSGLHLK